VAGVAQRDWPTAAGREQLTYMRSALIFRGGRFWPQARPPSATSRQQKQQQL